MYWMVVVLLVIVLVFGASSMMSSYATAKQAQATIEVAKAAQFNALGILIVILVLALLIIVGLIVLVYVLRSGGRRSTTLNSPRRIAGVRELPPTSDFSPGELIAIIEALQEMRSLRGSRSRLLQAPPDERFMQFDEQDLSERILWPR